MTNEHILEPPPPPPEAYLGDAVIASFDGYSMWLRTDDGQNMSICLEPAVFRALVEFAKSIDKSYGVNHFFSENEGTKSDVRCPEADV